MGQQSRRVEFDDDALHRTLVRTPPEQAVVTADSQIHVGICDPQREPFWFREGGPHRLDWSVVVPLKFDHSTTIGGARDLSAL